MTEELGPDTGPLLPDWLPPEIDQSKPHPARMYDYMLGGNSLYS